MATERRAEVTWNGDLFNGSGTIDRVGSGAFGPLDVTWTSRAEDPNGRTSPEELIAAAHASCFSMALSNVLAKAGTPPEQLKTSATVTFVPGTGITRSVLEVEGTVPGVDESAFREAAEDAKANCPVSQALKNNVELSVNARVTQASSVGE
jgi:osmotically inducible protein OsmC